MRERGDSYFFVGDFFLIMSKEGCGAGKAIHIFSEILTFTFNKLLFVYSYYLEYD